MLQDGNPIRGDILRKAFEQFDYLGVSARELLIEAIVEQGIKLDEKHYHSLEDIEKRFNELFGGDVTPLLIERLKKILAI